MVLQRHLKTVYAVRTATFAWCFAVVGAHAWDRGYGAAPWIAAALYFLAWPHLARLRSASVHDGGRAESEHLYLDALACGAWIAALDFPLWIACLFAFVAALGGVTVRGLRGLAAALGSLCVGMLAAVVFIGYRVWPMTGTLATALSFAGILAFGAGIGFLLYRQLQRMSGTREELIQSERRYRRIAEQAGDLVAVVDREGKWLYSSPSYARLFSSSDLAAGADALRNLHEEDQFRVRGALQVVVRGGESCRLRMRLHTRDGDIRRFEALAHPLREQGGEGEEEVLGAVLVARDVTGQREREEQLEVGAHAFERLSEALMISNAAGRILSVNQAFCRLTGYAPEHVIGRQESEIRSAMQPESFYDALYAEVLRDGRWSGSSWCRRRDGSVYHEWRSVSAVRDADGRVSHYLSQFHELLRPGDSGVADVAPTQRA